MARWVYRVADGALSHRCQYPDAVKGGEFATIDLPDDQQIDVERHVVDAGVVRLRTAQERAARATAELTRQIAQEGRREDVVTTIAWVLRRENPAGFDALTAAQKRNLISQQADVWRTIRATIKRSDF
jgi:hypothetical protein